ncbi:MAG: AbrB/MazE/SpoVT family DNA-binding domain-containing protein [Chloroflexi bacterium]|nr:AbrB/MazE/SpoVT family DNA-binding domain-containing protein [Chloroflexota bacterium]
MRIRVSARGNVTIPVALRRKFDIETGTRIHIHEEDGKIVLQPITRHFIHQLRGSLKGKNMLKALLRERKYESEL